MTVAEDNYECSQNIRIWSLLWFSTRSPRILLLFSWFCFCKYRWQTDFCWRFHFILNALLFSLLSFFLFIVVAFENCNVAFQSFFFNSFFSVFFLLFSVIYFQFFSLIAAQSSGWRHWNDNSNLLRYCQNRNFNNIRSLRTQRERQIISSIINHPSNILSTYTRLIMSQQQQQQSQQQQLQLHNNINNTSGKQRVSITLIFLFVLFFALSFSFPLKRNEKHYFFSSDSFFFSVYLCCDFF